MLHVVVCWQSAGLLVEVEVYNTRLLMLRDLPCVQGGALRQQAWAVLMRRGRLRLRGLGFGG